jgi:hypothetical protein
MRLNIVRYALSHDFYIIKSEILAHDTTPTIRAETDFYHE